jgi:hypothetical protein
MQQRTIRIKAIVEDDDQLILYGDNPGYAVVAPLTVAVAIGDLVAYEHLERNVGRLLETALQYQAPAENWARCCACGQTAAKARLIRHSAHCRWHA